MQFPNVDHIPLPAPVWLFKALHIFTLALHFLAVQLLIGGLLLAIVWNFLGRKDPASLYTESSNILVKRLPVVTTYVVNLGIPPLLFAQVLYGRALYTSSILIGVYWLAVIFLLMTGYYLLYVAAKRAEQQKPWWIVGIISFLLFAYIARIYTTNMTLMVRPEIWLDLYRANPFGSTLPKGDPTLLLRWLYMMVSSISLASVASILLVSNSKVVEEKVKEFIHKKARTIGYISAAIQIVLGNWIYGTQPSVVKEGLLNSSFYHYSLLAWIATSGLFLFLIIFMTAKSKWVFLAVNMLMGVLSTIMATIVRDGIRDLTLLDKRFNVWSRFVVTNWSTVILFLLLFAAGLLVISWLIKVGLNTKGELKSHA